MRTLITGIDDEGRSCVASDSDVIASAVPGIEGVLSALLYRTTESPPPTRPPALAANVDVQLPPGILRVMVVEHRPGEELTAEAPAATMHNTDALDIMYVLSGEALFLLEDGAHAVAAGDCVITTGVDHAWQVGPGGLRSLVISVGTPRLT